MSQVPFYIVIPARYASSRLPGKPLLDIAGKPMIQRVYEQACTSSAQEVIVATDDQRIVDAVNGFDGKVCVTRADHNSGTDRLQEVVQQQGWDDEALVVNVQGDEPLIPAAVIDQVAANLANNAEARISTLCERIADVEVFQDPNAVKVVFDNAGMALYFSRAPVPWPRDLAQDVSNGMPDNYPAHRHIGIYAYRASLLHDFITWPVADLERIESLEQLRAMANGVRIHVEVACETVPAGVDTEADLEAVRKHIAAS